MISIRKLDEETFEVTVQSQSTTTHNVTLSKSYYEKLAGGRVTPERLVEISFEFLLQREPNTSILRKFDLPVIGHYFPEYETDIRKAIAREGIH